MHQDIERLAPMEEPLTNVVREAILNNMDRNAQYIEIMNELGISRGKAKQLFFAFLWHAEEAFLQQKLLEPVV